MDVKIIKENGLLPIYVRRNVYEKGQYLGFMDMDDVRFEHYTFKLIYDDVLFYGGDFGLVESETTSTAVFKMEVSGKVTPEKCLKLLEAKLKSCGKTIHEVKREHKLKNLNLELWLTELLSM